eukprot:3401075-Amphidinium_carterae.1
MDASVFDSLLLCLPSLGLPVLLCNITLFVLLDLRTVLLDLACEQRWICDSWKKQFSTFWAYAYQQIREQEHGSARKKTLQLRQKLLQ